jgi:hypothetical protein
MSGTAIGAEKRRCWLEEAIGCEWVWAVHRATECFGDFARVYPAVGLADDALDVRGSLRT